jgi:hypothetical protein
MKIEDVKRWHWALIGVAVGLLSAWAWTSFTDAGGLGRSGTIGARDFEADLAAPPQQGHPIIRDVAVYQNDGQETVRMKVLTPDDNDPHPYNPRHFHYAARQLNATTPYVPGLWQDASQTVTVRLNPSALDLSPEQIAAHEYYPIRINEKVFGSGIGQLGLNGWKSEPGVWSDPGAGSTASLSLRPATYDLLILLSPASAAVALDHELAITFNGLALPPMTRSMHATAPVWQTTLPREAFVPGDVQTLKFARKTMPVKIREIRLADPKYTVLDYLAYARQKHPEIMFHAAWWDMPRVKYPLWALGGMLLIGGIWPNLLGWMTGAARAKQEQEDDYNLDRFKSEPSTAGAASEHPVPALDLSALEEELKRGLEEQPAAAIVSKAASTMVAPLPVPEAHAAPSAALPPGQTQESSDYRGEYYPVAHPPEKKASKP